MNLAKLELNNRVGEGDKIFLAKLLLLRITIAVFTTNTITNH